MRVRVLLIILATASLSSLNAQYRYQYGYMPTLIVTKKIDSKWRINLQTESRQQLGIGNSQDGKTGEYDYVQTDISALVSRSVGLSSSLNLGYLLRTRNGENAQRLMQQYVHKSKIAGLAAAYRLAQDYTWTDEQSIYRLRTRVSLQIPLQGRSLDNGESYLKINHEHLGIWNNDDFNLESRLVTVLGRKINQYQKIEIGPDYRLDGYINRETRHRVWLRIDWYWTWPQGRNSSKRL